MKLPFVKRSKFEEAKGRLEREKLKHQSTKSNLELQRIAVDSLKEQNKRLQENLQKTCEGMGSALKKVANMDESNNKITFEVPIDCDERTLILSLKSALKRFQIASKN